MEITINLQNHHNERWSEMEPIIFQYMQNAVSGSMSVDEACEAMTKDIDVLLAN